MTAGVVHPFLGLTVIPPTAPGANVPRNASSKPQRVIEHAGHLDDDRNNRPSKGSTIVFQDIKKPPLPPQHIIKSVQDQMDWAGADALTAIAALQQASRVTEFSQVDALPVGTLVLDSSGQLVRKIDDESWMDIGDESGWTSATVLLPAHVLMWGRDHA